jgi:hypothetical protein
MEGKRATGKKFKGLEEPYRQHYKTEITRETGMKACIPAFRKTVELSSRSNRQE